MLSFGSYRSPSVDSSPQLPTLPVELQLEILRQVILESENDEDEEFDISVESTREQVLRVTKAQRRLELKLCKVSRA